MMIFFVFLIFAKGLSGQDPIQKETFQSISSALGQGNSKQLASFFNRTIDIGLPGSDNSFSATQGEMVIREFFKNNPPVSFETSKQGATDASSQFIIGQYLSLTNHFQVYIYLRKFDEKFLIHKIKFEEKKKL